MKVYLCGRYGRRDEFRELRNILEKNGVLVVSRWLDTDWERKEDGGSSAAPAEYRQEYAEIDMRDVLAADAVVCVTEPPRGGGRGGRHVEFGLALAWGKKLVVVGYRENLFYEHERVAFESLEHGGGPIDWDDPLQRRVLAALLRA